MKQTRARTSGALVLGAVLAVVLSACLSGGRTDIEDSKNSGGGAGDNSGYTIAMITHETPGDTFWDKIQRARRQPRPRTTGSPEVLERPGRRPSRPRWSRTRSTARSTASRSPWPTPDAIAGAVKTAIDAGIPVVGLQLRHRPVQEGRREDVLRLGRDAGRRDRR